MKYIDIVIEYHNVNNCDENIDSKEVVTFDLINVIKCAFITMHEINPDIIWLINLLRTF